MGHGSSDEGYFSVISGELIVFGNVALAEVNGLLEILSSDFNITFVLGLEGEKVIAPRLIELCSIGVASSREAKLFIKGLVPNESSLGVKHLIHSRLLFCYDSGGTGKLSWTNVKLLFSQYA